MSAWGEGFEKGPGAMGWVQKALDVLIVAASCTAVSGPGVLLSAAGAVVVNLVVAFDHRPDQDVGGARDADPQQFVPLRGGLSERLLLRNCVRCSPRGTRPGK